jgi:autotransporter-associated beta strand protein
VTNIVITSPSSTTANLTIDSTAGNPVPTGGLTYGGGGGLIKTGSGHVTLSGANTYTGGTAVSDGTLLITATNVLADGGSLTVGAGGTFVFDPSQSASSSLAAGLAAPAPGRTTPSGLSTPIVAPSALDNVPGNASARSTLSPFLESQVKNLSHVPRTAPTLSATPGSTLQTPAINKSRATIFAVFASHRSALNRTVSSADIARSASSWAWLAAIESFWNSSGQNRMTGSTVEALDKVLAQFGL